MIRLALLLLVVAALLGALGLRRLQGVAMAAAGATALLWLAGVGLLILLILLLT